MPNITEIEAMVVRLLGDSAGFQAMIDKAVASTTKAAKDLGDVAKEAENAAKKAMNEAAQITLNARTATERYADTVKNLQGHLEAGRITQETFNRSVKSAEPVVAGIGAGLQQAGLSITGFGAAITGVFGGMATAAVYSAGKFEQTTIAFETMLGSASQTTKLLGDLTTFAAETPFEMPEIEQAARGLVQFGERGEELMETLKIVGNAAAGTSTSFGFVGLVMNQIRGVGHLLTQDFRQLSTRGILSLDDIAKHFGTTTEAAQGMISAGRVTFKDVKDIFRELSAEGGRFANLMEKQSKSVLGRLSTLKDNFNIVLRQIGEQLAPTVGFIIEQLNTLTGLFGNLDPVVKTALAGMVGLTAGAGMLITGFGGLVLAGGALAASWNALVGIGPTLATIMLKFVSATTLATTQTWALTAATVALKAVLIAGALAGIAAVAYGIYKAVSAMDEFDEAQKKSSELHGKWVDNYNKNTERMVKIGASGVPESAKAFERGEFGKGFLEEEMKKARQEAANYTGEVLRASQKVVELNTAWGNIKATELAAAQSHLKEMSEISDAATKRVKDLGVALKKLDPVFVAERVATLSEELDKLLSGGGKGEKIKDAIAAIREELEGLGPAGMAAAFDTKKQDDMLEGLRIKIVALNSDMSSEQVALYKASLDGLVTNKARGEIEALIETLNKAESENKFRKEQEKNAEAVEKLTEKLKEQIFTFNMNDREKELNKMAGLGATEDQMRRAEKDLDKLSGLELTKKFGDPKGPTGKYTVAVAELKRQLELGNITQDIFTKGMIEAQLELAKTEKKVKGVSDALKGFHGVAVGSAEDFRLLAEFQAGLPSNTSVTAPTPAKSARDLLGVAGMSIAQVAPFSSLGPSGASAQGPKSIAGFGGPKFGEMGSALTALGGGGASVSGPSIPRPIPIADWSPTQGPFPAGEEGWGRDKMGFELADKMGGLGSHPTTSNEKTEQQLDIIAELLRKMAEEKGIEVALAPGLK